MQDEFKIFYQYAAEMAKHHANYRFTMFGFFVTVMLAINGAVFYLTFQFGSPYSGLGAAFLAIAVAFLAIMLDYRTLQLYQVCQSHASAVEKGYLPTTGLFTVLFNYPADSVRAAFSDMWRRLRKNGLATHSSSIWLLYLLSALSSLVIVAAGFLVDDD